MSLAIAIQVISAAFLDAVVTRRPAGRSTQELAIIASSVTNGNVSYPDYIDIRDRVRSFSHVFAYSRFAKLDVSDGESFTTRFGCAVSGDYFQVLGVEPLAGRLIEPEDDVKNGPKVAVISSGLAAYLNVGINKILMLNGDPFRIVGILPKSSGNLELKPNVEIWIPLWSANIFVSPGFFTSRDLQWVTLGGRLGTGIGLAAARSELAKIALQLQKDYTTADAGLGLTVMSIQRFRLYRDGTARAAVVAYVVIWTLFILAFSNLMALLVLQVASRRREIAVRQVLGATQVRTALLLLKKVLATVTIALVIAMIVCYTADFLVKFSSTLASVREKSQVDITISGISLAVIVAYTIGLVMFVVCWRSVRNLDLNLSLREGSSAPRRMRTLGILCVIQVASCVAACAVAASFAKEIARVSSSSAPFKRRSVFLVDVNLRTAKAAETSSAKRGYLESTIAALTSLPGVISAGTTSSPPFSPSAWTNLFIDGKPPEETGDRNYSLYSSIGPGVFEALDTRIIDGRTLNAFDLESGAAVGLVDVAAARRFWPNGRAVGRTFKTSPSSVNFLVVGVVDSLPASEHALVTPRVYIPYTFSTSTNYTFCISVRSDDHQTRYEVSRALTKNWPYKTPPDIRTLAEQVKADQFALVAIAHTTLGVALLSIFVATMGSYVFSASIVHHLRRDTAIRSALGAQTRHLVSEHIRRFIPYILIGMVAGIALIGCLLKSDVVLQLSSSGVNFTTLNISCAFVLLATGAGLILPALANKRHLDLVQLRSIND